jgi:hypothetical protein
VVSRISVYEVKRRLRALGEPITLFGEEEEARLERLKQVEVRAHDRHTSSMGRKAEFQDIAKEVQDEIDRALLSGLNADSSSGGAEADPASAADSASASASSTAAGSADGKALTEEEKAKAKKEKAAAKLAVDKSRSEFKYAHDYVLHFLKVQQTPRFKTPTVCLKCA